MASGHVNRATGRTHGCTDQCCKREECSCQLGAVHTWHALAVPALQHVRQLPRFYRVTELTRPGNVDPTRTRFDHQTQSGGSTPLEAVMSLRVCKAHLCLTRAQPSGSPQSRFGATAKAGLSKQVCGRRKQERASDSAGPKNDSVKSYSCRAL
jgi:hypothetical protein